MSSSNCSRGEEGNTDSSPCTRNAIRWSFTVNLKKASESNNDQMIQEGEIFYKKIISYSKFIFISLEIGEKEKRYHLQGYIEFIKKKRFKQVKWILGDKTHIFESNGTREDNIIYCNKDPIYKWEYTKVVIKSEYTNEELGICPIDELLDWHKEELKNIEKKPDGRTINWIWSNEGKIFRKTTFIKYLMRNHNAKFVQGAKKDIMNSLVDEKKSIKENLGLTPLIIFGFSRTCEDFVSYDAIESLCDGIIFNSKYKSECALIPAPHIYVLCNFPPDKSCCSKDRWRIIHLDEEKEIEEKKEIKKPKLKRNLR